jgi:hypothetical protein
MSNSRTFPGVTPEILSRMKELGRAEHATVSLILAEEKGLQADPARAGTAA